MNPRVARFLSYVLHPVWMPAYALFLLFQLAPSLRLSVSPALQWALYAVILLNTVIIPLIITYFLLHRGWVRTLDMEDKEERIVPYLANALCLLLAYYMMKQLQVPALFSRMMLGAVAAVVLAIIINFRWKISIHMIGVGGLTGVFFGMSAVLLIDLRTPIVMAVLVSGLLATARLSIGAHHPAQLYAGFLAGFLCEFVLLAA